eukprot:2812281-Prymnesium_polylepis.1
MAWRRGSAFGGTQTSGRRCGAGRCRTECNASKACLPRPARGAARQQTADRLPPARHEPRRRQTAPRQGPRASRRQSRRPVRATAHPR